MTLNVDPAAQRVEEITEASDGLREVAGKLKSFLGHLPTQSSTPVTLDLFAEMLLTVTLRLIELSKETAALRIDRIPTLTGS